MSLLNQFSGAEAREIMKYAALNAESAVPRKNQRIMSSERKGNVRPITIQP